jgi:competence protein ComEC
MAIIYLGIAWLIGLWLASVVSVPVWLWLLGGAGSLITAVIFHQQSRPSLLLGCLGLMCLGAVRYNVSIPQIDQNHVAYYNDREEIALTGLVSQEPEVRDRSIGLRLQAEKILLTDGSSRKVNGLVQLTAPRYPVIPYGARVQAAGRLATPGADPEFDYRTYLARQGVHSQMRPSELSVLAEGEGSPIRQAIYGLKDRARSTIQRQLPDPQAALLTGILLGDDSGMPPDLEEQFRITGTSHIIAISGFNIAILAGILLVISRSLFNPRWSIALYALLVGAEPAVVRAVIMASLIIVATRFMGRPTYVPAALFTAALFMTLIDPFILWSIGFQLSFAAVLGLMLYVGPWSQWVESRLQPVAGPETANKLSHIFAGIALTTLAAMLLTMPIIMYHFGQISLVSPLANLFILPAQAGIMTSGGLATITGMVVPVVGQAISWVAWLFLTYTIELVRFFASMPGAAVPVSLSPAGVVAVFALIFGLTYFARQPSDRRARLNDQLRENLPLRAIIVGVAIIAIVAMAWALTQPDGELHVAFLDVGQGDATFIQTPSGRQILVDGGAYPTVLNDQLGRQMPFWDRSIDLIIATHDDQDHVSGLPGVFDRYKVDQLITNGLPSDSSTHNALIDAAAGVETPIHYAQAGEVIEIGDGVRLEILSPNIGPPTGDGRPQTADENDNDNSVVVRLVYENFSLLLTGDASDVIERKMVSAGRPLSAIVFKAGHHGARSSSSKRFLEAVQPQFVIISAGEGNSYGHPHEEVLQRAGSVGAAVLRTDELGTIEVITDGQGIWWEATGE